MTIRFRSAAGASAFLLAVVGVPGVAGAQTDLQAAPHECVRRAAPPSSAPHDVFRRIVCVPRNATTFSEGRCRQRCRPVVEPAARPEPPSAESSQPDRGALR